jgi:hypothetical protein
MQNVCDVWAVLLLPRRLSEVDLSIARKASDCGASSAANSSAKQRVAHKGTAYGTYAGADSSAAQGALTRVVTTRRQ